MTRSIEALRAAAGIPLDAKPWEPTADEVAELMFEHTRRALNTVTPPAFQIPIPLDSRLEGWADSFVTDPTGAPSLLLVGPTGTGKSHQAFTLLRLTVAAAHQKRQRPNWKAVDHAAFAERMRPHPDGDHVVAFNGYANADLLLFDDVGAAFTREWGIDRFQSLVNHRWSRQLPTIWTTNVVGGDVLKDAFGDRVVSRIWAGRRIAFEGTDRRRAAR